MRFFCPACGTAQTMDDASVPLGGTSVDCAKCGFAIKLKAPRRPTTSSGPARAAATQTQMARSAPAAANDPQDEWADEDTDPGAQTPPVASAAADIDDLSEDEEFDAPADEPPEAAAVAKPVAKPVAPKAAQPAARPAARPKARPAAKPKTHPKLPGSLALPYFGCGRSADRFRFRDLFYALQAPLDLRKTAVAAVGVFVGSALLIAIGWLSSKTQSSIGMTVGMIVGLLVYFACLFWGMAVAARQTDFEMAQRGKLPMSEGLGFVNSRLLTAVGFPFVFVIGIVALGAGIAVFHLAARIPVAGPIVFGLGYGLVFVMGLLAVLIAILMVFSTFSYVPAAGERGLLGLSRHMWGLVKKSPGGYSLHLLVSLVVIGLLFYVFSHLIAAAMTYIAMVGGWVGGGEYGRILMSMPGGLFPMFALLFDSGMHAGANAGWQFTLAGWMVFIVMMAIFSLVQGFLLTYFQAAGVVNYRLLTQDDPPE